MLSRPMNVTRHMLSRWAVNGVFDNVISHLFRSKRHIFRKYFQKEQSSTMQMEKMRPGSWVINVP